VNPRQPSEAFRAGVIKKAVILGFAAFILAVLQCSFLSGLSFLSATPDIVMGAVAAVALFNDERTATVFAISAGFILDALGGSGIPISPLTMLLASVLFSLLSKKMLKGFFPYSLLLLLASAAAAIFTAFSLLLAGRDVVADFIVKSIMIPEFILTFIFSVPLYPLFKLISRLCESKGRFKI
jgi:rod shape-determining protein MreD